MKTRVLTPVEVRGEKVFEWNNVTWIMRETLYREGKLAGQVHVEVYDPMDLDDAEFQIYLLAEDLDDYMYITFRNQYLKDTMRDIKRLYA